MIVESDDFNKQLYPKFALWISVEWRYFLLHRPLFHHLELKSKPLALFAPRSFNPGGPISLCLPSIPFFSPSNYRVSLDLAAAHVAVRLPLYGFISLFLLLALPSHLLLLLNPVSLTFWSKTPSEVQLFHPGIFLTSSSPWRAGMWTHLNSDLETLKVRWS